ncbi:hypothetical protein [Paeniglutamicibacter kerguelensis]|uniref:Vacuolar-type H+-ATPase subunit I/STV1 n=1 Tax=Paeniglutamicibacter kerguelensis TaxID=254788 RepID=A0ABS4XBN0_9MICC|nr:vacuolar-type H+-ATPase subunit I/STV1 [Paeniglutamicibacter kerguelensis]
MSSPGTGSPGPAKVAGIPRPAGAGLDGLPPPTGNRVRVSAPAGSMPGIPHRPEPDAADAFYVRSLIRSQLRLAVSVALGFLLLLVGLAVMVTAWPQIHDIRLATIPLPWWLLGVAVYPLILLSAFLFNKAAARNEARYRSIVEK